MSYGAIGKSVFNYLLVFLGGGLGASLRHFVNIACAKGIGTAFPYGTFIVNVSGAFVIGIILAYLGDRLDISPLWRLFFVTDFSAFSTATGFLHLRQYALTDESAAGASIDEWI